MVSKCANPACSTPFHYLREGKIFKVEVEVTPSFRTDAVEPANGTKIPFLMATRKPNRKLEHFWLCGPCSQTMNLLFDKDNGVVVVPKAPIAFRVARAAAS